MPSVVTAKVRLSSKNVFKDGATLTFYADYADGKNEEWKVATPSLNLNMTVNTEVAKLFVQGEAYTLTFTQDE